MESNTTSRLERGIYIFLAVITLALYSPAGSFDFIDYDDPWYVKDNSHVQNGFSWEGIKWAFTRLNGDGQTYWHPMTWLSHMLDGQLFGVHPGRIHLMNAFLHTVTTLLLFNILFRLTRAHWRSALVTAVFAWHPLQIGTVAWIAERKNILGTLFALLAIRFYMTWVRSERNARRHWLWYGAALVTFAASLMSKPILITLPFVLLLLDFWPLGRVTGDGWRVTGQGEASTSSRFTSHVSRLFLEKVPFFILAIISGLIMIKVHKEMDLIASGDQLPLLERIANAFVGYWSYARRVFWPDDLSFFYPLPEKIPVTLLVPGVVFVLLGSALATFMVKKKPYFFVGWFWFLGTMVPFIGLIQVNDQAMADRFIYVPLIGFLIALVWGLEELLSRIGRQAIAIVVASVSVIFVIVGHAWELGYWKNSETLFRRAIEVNPRNSIALNNYGIVFANRGQTDDALACYAESVKIKPDNANAQYNLGLALMKKGSLDEAAQAFLAAIKYQPNNPTARIALGTVYFRLKKYSEAAREFTAVTRLRPDKPDAFYFLGNVHEMEGNFSEALSRYADVIKVNPNHVDAHLRMGVLFSKTGKPAEALQHFQKVKEARPDISELYQRMAKLFLELKQSEEAAAHYRKALELNPSDVLSLYGLGLIEVAQSRNENAARLFNEVLRLQPDHADAKEQLGKINSDPRE